jgi:hypothetical protein
MAEEIVELSEETENIEVAELANEMEKRDTEKFYRINDALKTEEKAKTI